MTAATEIRLTGNFGSGGFVEWICHRARLLDLSGWVRTCDSRAIEIVVCGPLPLVDAMEMACSLGPANILVEQVESRPRDLADVPNGFHAK